MTSKSKNKPIPWFPRKLLNASATERLQHFIQYRTEHDRLTAAHADATAAITSAAGPRVVIIAGPTGVGKTTVARRLYKEVRDQYTAQMKKDAGFVPVVGISAVPPNGASFNWKDFYIRLLERHGDVMVDKKLLIPRQSEIFVDLPAHSPLERSVVDALRRSVENTLRLRKTKVLIIDEAHHILMVNDPRRLEYQFETLKALTIETNATLVLVGTYRLLQIRDQCGQLVRRSRIVHFPRYDVRKTDDVTSFASVLEQFRRQLPLEVAPNFTPLRECFYMRTGGCVGVLKDWLTQSLEYALTHRLKTIDQTVLDKFALSNKSMQTIIEEAMLGEEKLSDIGTDVLKDLLQHGIGGTPPEPSAPMRATTGRPRPGERSPGRDETGGVRNVGA